MSDFPTPGTKEWEKEVLKALKSPTFKITPNVKPPQIDKELTPTQNQKLYKAWEFLTKISK